MPTTNPPRFIPDDAISVSSPPKFIPDDEVVTSPKAERTKLSPLEEPRFRQWAKQSGIEDVDHPDSYYDYRGLYKELKGKPVPNSPDRHFPDTYKTHGHPTFSVESQYSAGPEDGGSWQGETFVPAGTKAKVPSLRERAAARLAAQGTSLAEMKRKAAAPDVEYDAFRRQLLAGGTPIDEATIERAYANRAKPGDVANATKSGIVAGLTGLGEGAIQAVTIPLDIISNTPLAGTNRFDLARRLGTAYAKGGAGGAFEEALPLTSAVTKRADKDLLTARRQVGVPANADTEVGDAVMRLAGSVVAPGPEVALAGRAVRNAPKIAKGIEEGASLADNAIEPLAREVGNVPTEPAAVHPSAEIGDSPIAQGGEPGTVPLVEKPAAPALSEMRVGEQRAANIPVAEEQRVAKRRGTSRLVAEQSPEELRRAALTSDKTGLPNLTAWNEVEPRAYQANIDLNNFKDFNTVLGHAEVDRSVLPALGELFKEAGEKHGVEFFHRSGDEFHGQHNDPAVLKAAIEDIDSWIRTRPMDYTDPVTGQVTTVPEHLKQRGLAYGIGPDETAAELAIADHKRQLLSDGVRHERAPNGSGVAEGTDQLGSAASGRNVQLSQAGTGQPPAQVTPPSQPPGGVPPVPLSGGGAVPPEGPIPKYARPSVINLNQQNVSDAAKRWTVEATLSDGVRQELEAIKGEPLTHAEQIAAAEAHGRLLSDPITRDATLDLSADLLHSRNILAEMETKGQLTKEYVELQRAVSSKATQLGRLLNSLGIKAGDGVEAVTMRATVKNLEDLGKTTDEIVEALKDVDFSNAKQASLAFEKTRPLADRFKSLALDIANAPRAIMASLDLSAPFRQGVFLVGRPKRFFGAFPGMLKSFGSESSYNALLESIKARPSYPTMKASGLAITDLTKLSAREEMFASSLAEHIPEVEGKGLLRASARLGAKTYNRTLGAGVKASGRAYTAFLDKLRADVFEDISAAMERQGLSLSTDKNIGKEIAQYVNNATGRGEVVDSLKGAQNVLNAFFFSPKLMASRVALLNPATYMKMSTPLRREALKDALKFAAVGTTVLSLAKLGGAEVGSDPRSADFGKIRMGDTRVDVWGGFQQYIRMAAQITTGQYVSTTNPDKVKTLGEGYKPMTRFDILLRQIESKEAPIASFVTSWLRQQDYVGLPFDARKEIKERLTPMMIQDFIAIQKSDPSLLPLMFPAALGVGVQTYDSPEEVERKKKAAKAHRSTRATDTTARDKILKEYMQP